MTSNQKTWESDKYYDLAKKGSLDRKHPGMKKLFVYSKKAKKILDFGCGEGTRLSLLAGKNKKLYGIDISKKAIFIAKRKYSKIKFFQGNIKNVNVDNDFDLIFSAFVLEHTRKTEELLVELINKLKRKGTLLLMAPNYGAPNRSSPVANYNRFLKLVVGMIKDIWRIFVKSNKLNWREVEPIADKEIYKMDLDTTIEPYMGTLIDFLSSNKMEIVETSSVWERELKDVKLQQVLFRNLGERGIYPFKYWGPHILVIAEKL